MNFERCKGCRTWLTILDNDSRNKNCVIQQNAPKRRCPCELCIVKPICASQCEEFLNLIAGIFRFIPYYDYKSPDKRTNRIQTRSHTYYKFSIERQSFIKKGGK